MKHTPASYIKEYAPDALAASRRTGMFPSIFLAQAMLESGYGNSVLAWKHNNHFGIKADASWKGKTATFLTPEYRSGTWVTERWPFRSYRNPRDSFRDRIGFLEKNGRYGTALQADTAKEQAWGLQKAGYATDPDYAQKLINMAEKHGLWALDTKKSRGRFWPYALAGVSAAALLAFAVWFHDKK